MPRPRLKPSATKSRVGVIAALALVVSPVGGCKHVRDFLIPPQSTTNVRAHRERPRAQADLVLRHARFDGNDDAMVAIGRGRIIAVGAERDVAKLIGPGTLLRDVRAGWLAPGFVDSHVHLDGMALLHDAIDLRGADLEEAKRRLLKGQEVTNDGGWMWAFGGSSALLAALDADKLDAMKPGLAVWISASDGHAAVVSDGLLGKLPAAGAALVKGKRGRLDAVTARAVWRLLPLPSITRARPLILQSLAALAEQGYTTVHALGVTLPFLQILVDLEQTGRLQSRVLVYLDREAPLVDRFVAERAARRVPTKQGEPPRKPSPLPDDESHKVRVVGLKMWLDGTLSARTAALSAPYADSPDKGALLHDDDSVAAALATADAAGLQLAVHAIGDAAVAQAVRVLAAAKRPKGAPPLRIEHAQVIAPATLAKMKGLPLLCAIQPLHERDDGTFAKARLGERMAWAYRARSLATSCPVTIGSDAPVSRPDARAAWEHVARTKTAEERMPTADALRALAVDPLQGKPLRIVAGQPADLVLWSSRPSLDQPPPRRLLMLIDGESVHVDASLPKPRTAPSIPR